MLGRPGGSCCDLWVRVRNSGPIESFPSKRRPSKRQLGVGHTVGDSGSHFPLPHSGSPYAQVPIFPLVSKQDAATLAKPKEGSQKVARQRNKPTISFGSHIMHERNQVQEVRNKQFFSCVTAPEVWEQA